MPKIIAKIKMPLLKGQKADGSAQPIHPAYALYRGHPRRIFAMFPARHQGHRHWVFHYKRGFEPKDAALTIVGPRGQKHLVAVVVRSDHAPLLPLRAKLTGQRGRPRIRGWRKKEGQDWESGGG